MAYIFIFYLSSTVQMLYLMRLWKVSLDCRTTLLKFHYCETTVACFVMVQFMVVSKVVSSVMPAPVVVFSVMPSMAMVPSVVFTTVMVPSMVPTVMVVSSTTVPSATTSSAVAPSTAATSCATVASATPPVRHISASNGTHLGRFVDCSFPLKLSFLNQGFESGVDQFLLLGIQFLIVSGLQMLAYLDQAGTSLLLVDVN